jgi:hypothetical protein
MHAFRDRRFERGAEDQAAYLRDGEVLFRIDGAAEVVDGYLFPAACDRGLAGDMLGCDRQDSWG